MSLIHCFKRINWTIIFPLLLFCSIFNSTHAQQENLSFKITWDDESLQGFEPVSFRSAEYKDGLPYLTKVFPLNKAPQSIKLTPKASITVNQTGLGDPVNQQLSSQFRIQHQVGYERKQPYLTVEIIPIKKVKGGFKLLQNAQIKVQYQQNNQPTKSLAKRGTEAWPNASPLAEGQWYRIGVDTTGVFKLTYEDLEATNIDVKNLNPDHLHLYGNGGRELPQNNNNDHPKGLKQTPLSIRAGNDGSFDKGDYLLFYGKGAHGWSYRKKNNQFRHNYHPYSDKSFYFLTVDAGTSPKRIRRAQSLSSAKYTTQTFNQLLFHEKDKVTEITRDIRSGRRWFGEVFSQQNSARRFSFNFTGIPENLRLRYRMAHHGSSRGFFRINTEGKQLRRISIKPITGHYEDPFANAKQGSLKFGANKSQITLNIKYSGGLDQKGWLDYLAVTGRAPLLYKGEPLMFQDKKADKVASVKYKLKGLNKDVQVWDVTNTATVHQETLSREGGFQTFTDSGQKVHRYMAFEPDDARSPSLKGEVENQNLHGLPQADMLIVTHPRFKKQAKALADFHQSVDNMKAHVVTPQAIYNEFASGKQDITAIRWFAKMFYDRADKPSEQPQYMVLFGDASFDYKDRLSDNTNLVPTYESPNSTDPIESYASDDYFGYLDDQEGVLDGRSQENFAGLLDLRIGRFPVNTSDQAKAVIEKIKRYHRDQQVRGSWQNRVSFVADDMEESWEDVFIKDSEEFTSTLNNEVPAFNMDKIYMDAFQQETASGGKRYPAVNEAISDRMNNGSLVINYMGHGGERGLADEKVVTFEDIKQWDNPHRMPLFVTATCEYTRYDDPGLLSAGERTFLRPDGGAIALLSTTRLVFAGANTKLTRQVFQNNMFRKVDGEHKTIGEVIVKAKNDFDKNSTYFQKNTRKFSLTGDPALKLAYPKNNVVTTKINKQPIDQADSLKALQKVTIEGEVQNSTGERLSNFNGKVFTKIFDKKSKRRTVGNDAAAKTFDFKILNSVIYDGQTAVEDGRFELTFVVPRDISYEFGKGKISYYAKNGTNDAHGYNRVTVGGTADTPVSDTRPPEVDLFLNTTNFEDGGVTGPDPLVLAKIKDDNGINTAANGIGHLPQLTIDSEQPVTLEDAYQASPDNFNQGTLKHQLLDLEPGQHYLQLKVWDVTNKVGSDQLSFVVVKDQQLTIESLTNYPNPFSDQTTIAFEHNQQGKAVTALIRIHNIQGRTVTAFKRKFNPEASRQTILWNGTNGHGQPLKPGVYICEVILEDERGAKVQESSRLVIQK